MPSEEEEGAISSSRHCASASPNIEVSQRGEREIREFAIIDALRNRRCPYPWSRRAEEHILSCPVVSCHHVLVSAEDRMMHKAEQVMHMYVLGTGSHQRLTSVSLRLPCLVELVTLLVRLVWTLFLEPLPNDSQDVASTLYPARVYHRMHQVWEVYRIVGNATTDGPTNA